MADKNKKVFEGKSAVDSALHDFCIKTKKPGFIDAICEVCEKVYETDQDTYICPQCLEKLKNKGI
jgi:predicted amidophosphoribosyltransferase